jgi:cysteine desulfurase
LGIVAFSASVKEKQDKPLAAWRDRIETALPQGAVVFGQNVERLGNTSCFALPEISAQKGLILFDLEGICLSAGAACSSGKLSASPTLLAQGFSEKLAHSALRLSLGAENTDEDIEHFIKTTQKIYKKEVAKSA